MGRFGKAVSIRLNGEIMNTLKSLTVAAVPLLSSGVVLAQTGTMMGGYGGGLWMQILLVVIVVALVVMLIRRQDK